MNDNERNGNVTAIVMLPFFNSPKVLHSPKRRHHSMIFPPLPYIVNPLFLISFILSAAHLNSTASSSNL